MPRKHRVFFRTDWKTRCVHIGFWQLLVLVLLLLLLMMMMMMMMMFFLLTPATTVLKSPALRLEFAKAAAEISKIAKQGTVRKYVERLQTLYDTADDGNRFTSGYAMNALATACLDKIQRYMPEIVPLAFMVREAVLCSFDV